MAEKSTFIKIDRNILRWRWYQDINTFKLFIHLLLKANINDNDFRDITVHRGQLVTSLNHLSKETGLTLKQTRIALEHLKETHEVAQSSTSKYTVITVLNYDTYQKGAQSRANKGHAGGTPGANKGQQSKNNKNNKNISKDIKNSSERAAFEADALAAGYVDEMGNPDLDAYLAHIEELRNS